MFILKHLIGRMLGFVIYSFLVGKYGYYRGQQIIYKRIQSQRSILDKILKYYVENPLQESALFLKKNLNIYKNNIDSQRLSTNVIEEYSDDSLMGYADTEYKGGGILKEQQRGQILPTLSNHLSALRAGQEVCEIGCGNGDVIAFLAETFPKLNFVGVDFSVKNAEKKHTLKNLRFTKGYALALLEQGELKSNVVYASSTFCVFNPKELSNYVVQFVRNNVENIIINEPTWGVSSFVENDDAQSFHLEGSVWHHNYKGYFRNKGYKQIYEECRPYLHPKSSRPDIALNICHYQL